MLEIDDAMQVTIRSVKAKTAENSAFIERIVDTLVERYAGQLTAAIEDCRAILVRGDDLSDAEVERLCLKVPTFMYFAGMGLENLGVEGDNAKAIRMEKYNGAYGNSPGTIQDKTHSAELYTIPEQLLEIAYNRAYKKLKTMMEVAESLGTSARKVLGKRMQDIDISRSDPGSSSRRGD